jgi:hypothetical protein
LREPTAPAGWYPDPSDGRDFRYWDGATWTGFTAPNHLRAVAPAGWYAVPDRPGSLRYWDGAMWTDHFAEPYGPEARTGGTRPAADEPRLAADDPRNNWVRPNRLWASGRALEE